MKHLIPTYGLKFGKPVVRLALLLFLGIFLVAVFEFVPKLPPAPAKVEFSSFAGNKDVISISYPAQGLYSPSLPLDKRQPLPNSTQGHRHHHPIDFSYTPGSMFLESSQKMEYGESVPVAGRKRSNPSASEYLLSGKKSPWSGGIAHLRTVVMLN